MAAPNNRYLGKFRGRVIDNNDPLGIGRITVQVPDVLGDEPSTWALPCLPFTGQKAGQVVVPPKDAGVWVEFEQGDPSFPIWTGCWYGERGELPPDAQRELARPSELKPVVVQTQLAHKIVMNDVTGPDEGILLQAKDGAYIRITQGAIVIAAGRARITLEPDGRVIVNEGRLTVEPNR